MELEVQHSKIGLRVQIVKIEGEEERVLITHTQNT